MEIDVGNVARRDAFGPIGYRQSSDDVHLSANHSRILAAYASGLRAREISKRYNYAESTVFWHLKGCKQVLGARNIAQAIAIAIGNGDISVPTGADAQVFSLVR
jgi:DNA-binding CsgD family transcriptional regulator